MKKILAILLALMTIGAMAFAEDAKPALTFGAYGDITATAYDNAGNTGYGLYTETYFNYAAKDNGFSATTVGGADPFAAVRNYKFYYNLNGGMFQLLAGKLREGPARLTSYVDGNGFSTRLANVQTGVEVLAKPVAGLVVAAFLPFTGAAVGTDFAVANFGVSYLVPNIANIVAGYRLGNSELWVGADVKAIKDVTLKVGFKMVSTTNYIYLTAGTTMDKLDLGLDADVVLGTTVGFGAKVKAEYAVSDLLSVGAKVSYDNGDAWYANNGLEANPYAKLNFAAGDIIIGFNYNTGSSTWSIPIDFELSY